MIFELDKRQVKKLKRWQNKLLKDNANTGAIGGRFIYQFTLTGIGMIVVCIDDMTGKQIDLTDYESW